MVANIRGGVVKYIGYPILCKNGPIFIFRCGYLASKCFIWAYFWYVSRFRVYPCHHGWVLGCIYFWGQIFFKKWPIFARCPTFWATRYSDLCKNWHISSKQHYLQIDVGDFWFFDFLAFFGSLKSRFWAPGPKIGKIWAKCGQKKPKTQNLKNPLHQFVDINHVKMCANFHDNLST